MKGASINIVKGRDVVLSYEQSEALRRYVDFPDIYSQIVACISAFYPDHNLRNMPVCWWPDSARGEVITSALFYHIYLDCTLEERQLLHLLACAQNVNCSDAVCDMFQEAKKGLIEKGLVSIAHGNMCMSDALCEWLLCGLSPELIELSRVENVARKKIEIITDNVTEELFWFYCSVPRNKVLVEIGSDAPYYLNLSARISHSYPSLACELAVLSAVVILFYGMSEWVDKLSEVLTGFLGRDIGADMSAHVCLILAEVANRKNGSLESILEYIQSSEDESSQIENVDSRQEFVRLLTLRRVYYLHYHERVSGAVIEMLEELAIGSRSGYMHINTMALLYLSRVFFACYRFDESAQMLCRAQEMAKGNNLSKLHMLIMIERSERLVVSGSRDFVVSVCEEIYEDNLGTPYHRYAAFAAFMLGFWQLAFGGDGPEALRYFRVVREQVLDVHLIRVVSLCEAMVRFELNDVCESLSILSDLLDENYRVEFDGATQPHHMKLTFCAVLLQMLQKDSMVALVISNAERHMECSSNVDYSWVLPYVKASVEVVRAVSHGCDSSSDELAKSISKLSCQRTSSAQRLPFCDGVEYVRIAIERILDQWLARQGVLITTRTILSVDVITSPSCFRVNQSPLVSLSRRRAMSHILAALLMHHQLPQETPPLSVDALFEAGWPDEHISYPSMQARVYNALSRLKKMGLESVILHDGVGYKLCSQCILSADSRLTFVSPS